MELILHYGLLSGFNIIIIINLVLEDPIPERFINNLILNKAVINLLDTFTSTLDYEISKPKLYPKSSFKGPSSLPSSQLVLKLLPVT